MQNVSRKIKSRWLSECGLCWQVPSSWTVLTWHLKRVKSPRRTASTPSFWSSVSRSCLRGALCFSLCRMPSLTCLVRDDARSEINQTVWRRLGLRLYTTCLSSSDLKVLFCVSGLSTEQMLLKDMKAASGGDLRLAVSVIYMTLEVSTGWNLSLEIPNVLQSLKLLMFWFDGLSWCIFFNHSFAYKYKFFLL